MGQQFVGPFIAELPGNGWEILRQEPSSLTLDEARDRLGHRMRRRCDGYSMAWSLGDAEAVRLLLSYLAELEREAPDLRRLNGSPPTPE